MSQSGGVPTHAVTPAVPPAPSAAGRPPQGRPRAVPWYALLVALVLWGTMACLLVTRWPDDQFVRTVDNLAQACFAALAAVAAACTALRSPGQARRSWAATAVGAGGWACGAAVWCWYELVAQVESPFPSAADVGYLVFPFATTVGLLLLPVGESARRRRRDLVDGVMVAAAIACISWTTTLGAVLRAGAENTFALVVSVTYPMSDVMIATAVIITLARSRGPRRTLGPLAAGLLSMAVADSLFAYFVAKGTYHTGQLVDLGWMAAFLFIALAAVGALVVGPTGAAQPDAGTEPRGAGGVRGALLPYAPVAMAGAALTVDPLRGASVDAVGLALAAVAGGAVLARQYLTLLENAHLVHEVAAREELLRRQAFFDPLTGLPNRALFNDRVSHALRLHERDGRPLAVVFCDLDAFKGVNDSLGHAAGDELLVKVGERLRGALHPADTLARLGGDEFAALLEDRGAVESSTHQMNAALAGPFSVAGKALHARASLGVARVGEGDATPTLDELLSRADVAMYTAKRAGGAQVTLHRAGMTLHESRDLALQLPLASAVERDLVRLHFQPIVQLSTGRVAGFEALARWDHAGRAVPPSVFIPLARRTGLLPQLTANLLERACRQIAEWSAAVGHDDVTVSVNTSPDHIVDSGFVNQVESALHRHGVRPHQLVLEITEEALLTDLAAARAVTGRLRAMGVPLALDDFGTGYSSLAHLHEIPLSSLKIDRAFVHHIAQDTDLARLVAGVVALGRDLGLDCVAEGVEQTEQAAALALVGCGFAQGYYYSPPRPPEAMTAWLGEVMRRSPGASGTPQTSLVRTPPTA